MNAPKTFKTSASAVALGLAMALSSGAAFAQGVEMSSAVVNAHKTDLDNMISDLSKVSSPDVAKGYETYLAQQMNQYTQNHKKLNAAIPSVGIAKRVGKFNPDMRKAVDAINALNDNQYTKANVEMDRVEKLNPGLKKHFDVLRSLND